VAIAVLAEKLCTSLVMKTRWERYPRTALLKHFLDCLVLIVGGFYEYGGIQERDS